MNSGVCTSIKCQESYSFNSSSSTNDIFFDLCVRFRLIEVERKSNEFMPVPNYLGSAFSSLPYCRKVDNSSLKANDST